MRFYSHFSLLMVRSPGFGSMATNFLRPIQTRSRFASGTEYLKLARYYNSPDRSTKSTSSHFNVLWVLVSTRFQVLFHSPPGVLFTFPSQYYALSVTKEYLALGGGPPDFPQGFSCLVVLRILPLSSAFKYEAFTLSGRLSQNLSSSFWLTYAVHDPGTHALRFRLFPFRSPLLRKSMFLSLPPPT